MYVIQIIESDSKCDSVLSKAVNKLKEVCLVFTYYKYTNNYIILATIVTQTQPVYNTIINFDSSKLICPIFNKWAALFDVLHLRTAIKVHAHLCLCEHV